MCLHVFPWWICFPTVQFSKASGWLSWKEKPFLEIHFYHKQDSKLKSSFFSSRKSKGKKTNFFSVRSISLLLNLEKYSNLLEKLEHPNVCFVPNFTSLYLFPHFKVQEIVLCPLTKDIQKHFLCQNMRICLMPPTEVAEIVFFFFFLSPPSSAFPLPSPFLHFPFIFLSVCFIYVMVIMIIRSSFIQNGES